MMLMIIMTSMAPGDRTARTEGTADFLARADEVIEFATCRPNIECDL
jgi:hypothetical protein